MRTTRVRRRTSRTAPSPAPTSQTAAWSNQDVGVLFAQVNSNATVANSSGNVTATSFGTGLYAVDLGRDISDRAATATVGTPDVGGARGVVTQLNERSGNAEGLWVRTADEVDTSVEQDLPFQVLVVC